MPRIVILGCAGAGKTTLARQLGQRTGAPVISLDEIWQPHWKSEDVPAFRSLIEKLHAGENWISDGNFAVATFDLRLKRATLVIWLERPKIVCMRRVLLRTLRPGEPHRLRELPKVLRFIWKFDEINRPRIEAMRVAVNPEVRVCRMSGGREVEEFVEGYGDERARGSGLL
jgi:adenylate kinase family enzyme